MMRRILINDIEHDVLGEVGGQHGWIALTVAEKGSGIPYAKHHVPTSWWRGSWDRETIHTGGATYRKAPADA